MPNLERIPVCRVYFTGKEQEYAQRAIASGWISSSGEFLTAFERKFAQFVGCSHGVACTNGTSAVHLALMAAGVGRGDRVVVPAFTMMASVFPIVSLGAIPVFVDCEKDSWTLQVDSLERVKRPVKAIMPVHIYGHPCDMDPIQAWAKQHGALVIEDAAEAQGATYKGKPAGSLSDMAAFSFYANKIITCGEGGMVTTQRSELARRVRYFQNLCFDEDPFKRFIHQEVGYNFRFTNVQAAIGLAQTEAAEKLVELRREMARKYLERLATLQDFIQLPCEKPWAKNSYWMFGIVLREGVRMKVLDVQSRLSELGIESRRFFCPGHWQPVFENYRHSVHAPNSEWLWERGFYLPSPSDLTDSEADRVVEGLEEVVRVVR